MERRSAEQLRAIIICYVLFAGYPCIDLSSYSSIWRYLSSIRSIYLSIHPSTYLSGVIYAQPLVVDRVGR